jgi:4-diphosphocytidyl-2-C-methyl-D-erythritol kinase
VPSVVVFSPAKLNLFLAVTGRRPDGFHDLVSVVAPVKFGDVLWVEPTACGEFSLDCDDPAVPGDETNLILRAAKLFKECSGLPAGARFVLEKRIPMGAGLGGGSSNAVAALLALNRLTASPLGRDVLLGLAVKLGSDCALFLQGRPVVMRGRGERVELLVPQACARLSGRRVLIFKPSFSIATTWAYGRMAAGAPMSYLKSTEAESRFAGWVGGTDPAEKLLFNNMETPAFAKYLALPSLLERLRGEFGLSVAMSGSGSACYALLRDDTPVREVVGRIHETWGRHTFIADTEIV